MVLRNHLMPELFLQKLFFGQTSLYTTLDTVGEFMGGATRRERMTSGKLEEKRCSRD
jgi:hypothetical protein